MNLSTNSATVPVIDYEGSGYRSDFWEGQGREYEDAAERAAIRELLPSSGRRVAEFGAGFGRLADLYLGFQQIILFDYSRTLLQDAVDRWGNDPRFVFVAGNIYQLPLATGILDALVMVRVMHHLADVPQALFQIHRSLNKYSVAVLEYANKRNLKALARWLISRQSWSPFSPDPIEFVDLNFDFHPNWMSARFAESGLTVDEQLAVSHFRLPILKRLLPTRTLVWFDSLLFRPGGLYPLSPSVFVRAVPVTNVHPAAPSVEQGALAQLFRCPMCGQEPLIQADSLTMQCSGCGRNYKRKNQIWDFKELSRQ